MFSALNVFVQGITEWGTNVKKNMMEKEEEENAYYTGIMIGKVKKNFA